MRHDGGDAAFDAAERDALDAVLALALCDREAMHQPIREGAVGAEADRLALELGHGLDRRILRDDDREAARRASFSGRLRSSALVSTLGNRRGRHLTLGIAGWQFLPRRGKPRVEEPRREAW
jgi:hypothetical protein